MARHFLRQHHAMPGRPDEPSPAELAARSPARAGQHSGSSHGCMARARGRRRRRRRPLWLRRTLPWVAPFPANSGLPSRGGQRPPGRAVEAISAF
ncbi:putative formin-like protein 18 isoform X1 [Iris pallida]|uniref:Formin-like protein 18 isoform X1 n=1 Tax=Iris pallida TaxID=29817 RepID=A0AAX6DQA7_IRIPA|nr:putative formin-like protein 18 isoform X1 [Iris pallida]KAJ6793869.1 putative formin-like protein 18 isoform X1 [Iris pallida]